MNIFFHTKRTRLMNQEPFVYQGYKYSKASSSKWNSLKNKDDHYHFHLAPAEEVDKPYQSTWQRSRRHWRLWRRRAWAPAGWERGQGGCRKHRWVWGRRPASHWPLWKTPAGGKKYTFIHSFIESSTGVSTQTNRISLHLLRCNVCIHIEFLNCLIHSVFS